MLSKKDLLPGAIIEVNGVYDIPLRNNQERGPVALSGAALKDLFKGDQFEIISGVRGWGDYVAVRLVSDPSIIGNVRISFEPGYNSNHCSANCFNLVTPCKKVRPPFVSRVSPNMFSPGQPTPSGLEVMKSGHLKFPRVGKCEFVNNKTKINFYGEPYVKVGDYVSTGSNRRLTAGTVGVVLYKGMMFKTSGLSLQEQAETLTVLMLDGTISLEHDYRPAALTRDQVNEVIDFYVNAGRPERVVTDILTFK